MFLEHIAMKHPGLWGLRENMLIYLEISRKKVLRVLKLVDMCKPGGNRRKRWD